MCRMACIVLYRIVLYCTVSGPYTFRWLEDPSIGSAQNELAGSADTEAHKQAEQKATILRIKRHYAKKGKE